MYIIDQGYALLHTTIDDEMTKKKRFKFGNFVIFTHTHDSNCTKYCPIIIQGDIQVAAPVYNSLKILKQLGWINIKSAKQVGIQYLKVFKG